MEREIKFRGKRLNNGEWVVGDLIHKNNGDVAIRTYLNVWVENSDVKSTSINVLLLRLKIYFGGASPNCGAGVRPYLIRRPALAHKNPTRFSRGSMSILLNYPG